jgi:CubicO group peptidase (beta-lactamase class C family)
MTGGFDVRKVEESVATRFVALLEERDSEQLARATVEVEADAPHRVTRWELRVVPRPAELAIQRLSEADLVEALRARLDAEAAAERFSGAVVLARDGKILLSAAYGLADRDKKIANTPATRFRIGSMNKMFTGTAVLQLVQAGKVRLEDPVGKYLADYPNKDVAAKVTIHHLLTHTGGTGDIFGPLHQKHRLELRALHDYVKLYGSRGLEFEPGARFAYSNYGMVLAGLIVEKASGMAYHEYVREHVFKPAGMTRSGAPAEDEVVADRSVGYIKAEGGRWRPNVDTLAPVATSAGGGISTAEDLAQFAFALMSRKLLDVAHTELLTTGKVEAGGGQYAYGFDDATVDGLRSFGHGGGAPGMNGDLRIYPSTGYVIAVLSNLDPPAAERVSRFVASRVPAGARQ